MRFELSGSGAGYITPERMKEVAMSAGAKNVRIARQFGWRNQPRTIRFSADDQHSADKIANLVSSDITPPEKLGPRLFACERKVKP
jgi:hypothetical protein